MVERRLAHARCRDDVGVDNRTLTLRCRTFGTLLAIKTCQMSDNTLSVHAFSVFLATRSYLLVSARICSHRSAGIRSRLAA